MRLLLGRNMKVDRCLVAHWLSGRHVAGVRYSPRLALVVLRQHKLVLKLDLLSRTYRVPLAPRVLGISRFKQRWTPHFPLLKERDARFDPCID